MTAKPSVTSAPSSRRKKPSLQSVSVVVNIAPTWELESFGPSLQGDLFDVFRMVCELSDHFSYGNDFPASFILAATCLLKLFWRRKMLRFFFADVLRSLFIYEMTNKKSCQNIRNPCVLFAVERDLYGWVDAEVFAQSSMITSNELPELHREIRLTGDVASERDFVLEAAGPSDRLPLQAPEDRTHFLWVYVELFTRLGVRLPFTDFQREVLARCRVADSQLHLNSWGFLRTFERVCLYFGFRPSWRTFLYTYQLHAPPPGNRFLSFRAYQGRRHFDAFEESIQESKWHYFKVLPLPGYDEGKPFP
ncbi:hypothetical protein PIB30_022843 [Stylosanthes scabra]|uniref:Uncharacterized protein n=1 Tax=Stylosanthes scabra TaxID=79078 RepID=A0ABU6W8Y7_9FABA|nr:hypothetical protein [Stylosanthes scabra]